MRKSFFIAIFFTACIFTAACSRQDQTADELQRKIREAFETGNKIVRLSSVTDFEWDSVCLFVRADDSIEPDSIREEIVRRGLNKDNYFADFSLSRWLFGESYDTAYLFVKDNRVAKIIRMFSLGPNTLVNEDSSGECIASNSAAFAFEKRMLAGQEHLVIMFQNQGG